MQAYSNNTVALQPKALFLLVLTPPLIAFYLTVCGIGVLMIILTLLIVERLCEDMTDAHRHLAQAAALVVNFCIICAIGIVMPYKISMTTGMLVAGGAVFIVAWLAKR
jgi:ABC-type enterochelin transport system permease subunit